MDSMLTSVEEQLGLFADMVKSACGLSLWCFGLAKQLYSCTSVTEKEFRLFLEVGQCLDYAIAHAAESSTPIMMSDPIGMLWVAEYVRHNADTGYIILLGPVFDVTTSPQTLNDHLRGMNLSVSLTSTISEKLNQVPVLSLPTLHQYIKMLHSIIYKEDLDIGNIRLQSRSKVLLEEKSAASWDPDRARLLEAEILQRIRTGNVYDHESTSNLQRFADKDFMAWASPCGKTKIPPLSLPRSAPAPPWTADWHRALPNSWKYSMYVRLSSVLIWGYFRSTAQWWKILPAACMNAVPNLRSPLPYRNAVLMYKTM